MEVTKVTTRKYDVTFCPNSPIDFIWKDFKRIRDENKQNTSKLDHCFCCEHKFGDEEKLIVVAVKGVGNRFACQECLKKEIQRGEEKPI